MMTGDCGPGDDTNVPGRAGNIVMEGVVATFDVDIGNSAVDCCLSNFDSSLELRAPKRVSHLDVLNLILEATKIAL